jgi:SAM-dependent methyltransferase
MFGRLRSFFAELHRDLKASAEQARLNADRLNHISYQVDLLTRENRVLMASLALPPMELWRGRLETQEAGPAQHVFPHSALCRQDSFEQPCFPYWMRKLGLPIAYHRKLWEYAYICQALSERGAIRRGARGLGFGVGREPLAALFAAADCEVVGTDMAPEAALEQGWSTSDQHAAGLNALRHPQVCPPEQFDRRVSFEVCDMNAIPEHLCGFDFCWSSCAFEHLGSIEQGLKFVENSLQCLKPGGWAVHTTEFNLSSNDHTLNSGVTVIFRQRDMEELRKRVTAQGHAIAPFDFDPGFGAIDRYVDVPPYRSEPVLKFVLEGYATTSIGLIVRRGEG